MSKRAWPRKKISLALILLPLAACQGGGGQAPSQAEPPLAAITKAGQAQVQYNGKEYILSLGASSKPAGGFGLPIPNLAGIQLTGAVEGVSETSASITAAMPLAQFMESFAKDYAARGYLRRRYMMAEGMGFAEWLAGKGTVARLYALEDKGGVRGKIVAVTGGK